VAVEVENVRVPTLFGTFPASRFTPFGAADSSLFPSFPASLA
jgi:hypothetical protein